MNNTASSLLACLTSTYLDEFDEYTSQLSSLIYNCYRNNKLVLICGNGGSAADAQHWAAELVCTYSNVNRPPYPALALTTDSSVLTAWSNDDAFDNIFVRQVSAFVPLTGLVIGLSTSGSSKNIVSALQFSSSRNLSTALISGNKAPINPDLSLHVRLPSSDTPTIQTLTQLLYHNVCGHIDQINYV